MGGWVDGWWVLVDGWWVGGWKWWWWWVVVGGGGDLFCLLDLPAYVTLCLHYGWVGNWRGSSALRSTHHCNFIT